MNKWLQSLLFATLCLVAPSAFASEVTIHEAWIREAPPVSKVQAAYMLISNPTGRPVELIGASSPFYSRVEFHRTILDKGLARMQQENTLTIPAKGEVHLQPEGTHMMLFNPRQPLKAGDNVPFTLTFSNQHRLDIMLVVKKATGATHHHSHH